MGACRLGNDAADLLRDVVVLDWKKSLITEKRVAGDRDRRQAAGAAARQIPSDDTEFLRGIGSLVRRVGRDPQVEITAAYFRDQSRIEDTDVVALHAVNARVVRAGKCAAAADAGGHAARIDPVDDRTGTRRKRGHAVVRIPDERRVVLSEVMVDLEIDGV